MQEESEDAQGREREREGRAEGCKDESGESAPGLTAMRAQRKNERERRTDDARVVSQKTSDDRLKRMRLRREEEGGGAKGGERVSARTAASEQERQTHR